MRIAGSYQFPTMESVIYGKPAAEALREEAERLDAKRVYLIASRTLNTNTERSRGSAKRSVIAMPRPSMAFRSIRPGKW